MNSYFWENKFNTGVETMDVQHRKIFDYLTTICNELEDTHQKCDPFNGMLDKLEILCRIHFLEEEKLMDDINYPSASEHKLLNDLFLANIDRFKIDNKRCHSPSILNDFIKLREDFITHIFNEGMTFGRFIDTNSREVSALTGH
jgi:hemerythrin